MTRWILSSIALHAALVIFVFISALVSRPEKDEDIFVVDLSAGMEQQDPAPEETPGEPEPEPTKQEEVTKVPTKEPTKKETPKPVPTKKETPKPKPKPTKKKTPIPIRTLPPKLRSKAATPPTPRPDPQVQERVERLKNEIRDIAQEPVHQDPVPVPTRRTVPKPAPNTGSSSQLNIKTTGMGRHSSNYYFVLMQRQLYKNWDHRAREGSPRKGEVTLVVLKDGTIDINRCRWNDRSGDSTFDDSVWDAVKKTELPQFPAEFTMAEITVTVTFRDEV